MPRLRSLSEAECYARCYGVWEGNVRVIRSEPRRAKFPVLDSGEVLRERFEELLDARDPDEPPEIAAA
jgi:hypothetical protein